MAPSNKRKRSSNALVPSVVVAVQASTPSSNNALSADGTDNQTETETELQTIIVECPFSVQFRQGPLNRKTPTPAGARRPPEDLNTVYIVHPEDRWDALKRFRAFTIANECFEPGDYVYINNANDENTPPNTKLTESAEAKFWIARIIEVKASDERHVYLRIYWMYRPEELEGGKHWYHGVNEVVNSNHMDVVDAMTVVGRAEIGHWMEQDVVQDLPMLYWRQVFDFMSKTVGEVRTYCKCDRPYNPDKRMYRCTNKECGLWLHEECLIEDVKKQALQREGPPPAKEDKMDVDEDEESSGQAVSRLLQVPLRMGVPRTTLHAPKLPMDAVDETPDGRGGGREGRFGRGGRGGRGGKKNMRKDVVRESDRIEIKFQAIDKAKIHVRDLRHVASTSGRKKTEDGGEGENSEWDEDLHCLACGTMLE